MDVKPSLTVPTADPHDAWRAADHEEVLAYRAWCDAAPELRREAYTVFVAAADRASAAAEALRLAALPAI